MSYYQTACSDAALSLERSVSKNRYTVICESTYRRSDDHGGPHEQIVEFEAGFYGFEACFLDSWVVDYECLGPVFIEGR